MSMLMLGVALLGCGAAPAPAPMPLSSRAPAAPADADVVVGHGGLRGLEDGRPITEAALAALVPGGVVRYADRQWTVELAGEEAGKPALRVDDRSVADAGRRFISIRSPRVRAAVTVRVGETLGEAARRHRIECAPRDRRQLVCSIDDTRFGLWTRDAGAEIFDFEEDVVPASRFPDQIIQEVHWTGPARTRGSR